KGGRSPWRTTTPPSLSRSASSGSSSLARAGFWGMVLMRMRPVRSMSKMRAFIISSMALSTVPKGRRRSPAAANRSSSSTSAAMRRPRAVSSAVRRPIAYWVKTMPRAPPERSRVAATRMTYLARRRENRLRTALALPEPVSDAPHRVDVAGAVARRFNFCPQPLDVHVHGALVAEVVVAPQPIQQLGAGEGLARPLHEAVEQVELLGGQRHFPAVNPYPVVFHVQADGPVGEPAGPGRGT